MSLAPFLPSSECGWSRDVSMLLAQAFAALACLYQALPNTKLLRCILSFLLSLMLRTRKMKFENLHAGRTQHFAFQIRRTRVNTQLILGFLFLFLTCCSDNSQQVNLN